MNGTMAIALSGGGLVVDMRGSTKEKKNRDLKLLKIKLKECEKSQQVKLNSL